MGNPEVTRAVFLKRRTAHSGPELDDFEIRELALARSRRASCSLRNAYMSVDPSMRGRLEVDEKHYTTNFIVDQPLDGSAIGEVIDSAESPAIPVGRASCAIGWVGATTRSSRPSTATVIDTDVRAAQHLAGHPRPDRVHGVGGLFRTGEFKSGEAVFVSAAAGAVGTAVGQFAACSARPAWSAAPAGRRSGRLLVDEFGFDDAFDYRAGPPAMQLKRVAPDGIDVYFDNVGGDQLIAALDSLRVNGRVALCGMISNFDAANPAQRHQQAHPRRAEAIDHPRLHRARPRGHAPGVRTPGR